MTYSRYNLYVSYLKDRRPREEMNARAAYERSPQLRKGVKKSAAQIINSIIGMKHPLKTDNSIVDRFINKTLKRNVEVRKKMSLCARNGLIDGQSFVVPLWDSARDQATMEVVETIRVWFDRTQMFESVDIYFWETYMSKRKLEAIGAKVPRTQGTTVPESIFFSKDRKITDEEESTRNYMIVCAVDRRDKQTVLMCAESGKTLKTIDGLSSELISFEPDPGEIAINDVIEDALFQEDIKTSTRKIFKKSPTGTTFIKSRTLSPQTVKSVINQEEYIVSEDIDAVMTVPHPQISSSAMQIEQMLDQGIEEALGVSRGSRSVARQDGESAQVTPAEERLGEYINHFEATINHVVRGWISLAAAFMSSEDIVRLYAEEGGELNLDVFIEIAKSDLTIESRMSRDKRMYGLVMLLQHSKTIEGAVPDAAYTKIIEKMFNVMDEDEIVKMLRDYNPAQDTQKQAQAQAQQHQSELMEMDIMSKIEERRAKAMATTVNATADASLKEAKAIEAGAKAGSHEVKTISDTKALMSSEQRLDLQE